MNSFIRNHAWLFELMAIAMVSYLLAKMTVNIVAVQVTAMPKAAPHLARDALPKHEAPALVAADYEEIVTRNVFDSEASPSVSSLEQGEDKGSDVELVSNGEPVLTTLSVQLISTFSVGEGKDARSNATVVAQGTEKDGEIFSVGENFQSGANIKQILYDRLIFSNNGRLEYVLLNDLLGGKSEGSARRKGRDREDSAKDTAGSEGVEQAGDNKFVIDRGEVESALANLDDLFRQVRAVPAYKDGKSSGLKLLSVKGDSLFAKLGLKRGDVLEQINGQDLDIQRGLELFNSLKSESHIALNLLRRGKKLTFDYEVR